MATLRRLRQCERERRFPINKSSLVLFLPCRSEKILS